MKYIINGINSLLLTISLFLVVLVFTLMNKFFIIHEFNKHNYYDIAINNIHNSVDKGYTLDEKLVKKDMNDYVSNYLYDKEYINKIIIDEDVIKDEYEKIYNKSIKVIGPYNNYRMTRDIVDIVTIVVIIVTGIVFIKTKNKHNLKTICIISSILGFIISFIILMNIRFDDLVNNILKDYYYIYLGSNVLLFVTPVYLTVYSKIVKKK